MDQVEGPCLPGVSPIGGKGRVLRAVFAVMSNTAVRWAWGGVEGLPSPLKPGERLSVDSSGGSRVTSPPLPLPVRRCAVVRGLSATKVTAVVGALEPPTLFISDAVMVAVVAGATGRAVLSNALLRPCKGEELVRSELSLKSSLGSWNWTENGVCVVTTGVSSTPWDGAMGVWPCSVSPPLSSSSAKRVESLLGCSSSPRPERLSLWFDVGLMIRRPFVSENIGW